MKLLITLFLFVFSLSVSYSQEEDQKESALLWKITGPNVKTNSYLFGTMHLIEREYFIFPKKLQKQVKKSDLLVMELSGVSNQTEALKYVMIEEGSFFDYFNEAQTDSILDWAKEKFKMEESTFRTTFSKMKPFVVTQLAVQLYFIGKTESYEKSFEALANDNEIKIEGLETIAEQMELFNDLSEDQQAAMVMENIRKGDETIEMLKKMQIIYKSQDVDELYQMIQSEGGVISEQQGTFLDERNQKWVPKIEEFIKNNDAFIAVGAGHLGGPNGVINLLEKEGYTLTPIRL